MEKREVAVVMAIIVVLAIVLFVSGVFYFTMVFDGNGLTGNVVVSHSEGDLPNGGEITWEERSIERHFDNLNG